MSTEWEKEYTKTPLKARAWVSDVDGKQVIKVQIGQNMQVDLWPNDYKQGDRDPDFRGPLTIVSSKPKKDGGALPPRGM